MSTTTTTKPFVSYHDKKSSTISTLNVQETGNDSTYNLPKKSGTLVTEEDVHKFASMVEVPVLTVIPEEGYVRGTRYQKGMFYLEDMVKSVWEFSLEEGFTSVYYTESITNGDLTSLFFPKYVAENADSTVFLRAKYVSKTMQSDWSEPLVLDINTIKTLGNNIFLIGKPSFELDTSSGTLRASSYVTRNNYNGTFGYMEVQYSTETVVDKPKFVSNTRTVRVNGTTTNVPEEYLSGTVDVWIRARFASSNGSIVEYSPYSDPFCIPANKFQEYIAAWKKILTPSLTLNKESGVFVSSDYKTREGFTEPLKTVTWEVYDNSELTNRVDIVNNSSTRLTLTDKLLAMNTDIYVRVKHSSNTEESLYSNTLIILKEELNELMVSLKKIKSPILDFNYNNGDFTTSSYATRDFLEPLKEVVWEFSSDSNFATILKTCITKDEVLYMPDDIVNQDKTIHVRAKHKSETEESLYSNVKSFTKEELANLVAVIKGIRQPGILEILKTNGILVISEPEYSDNFSEPVTSITLEYSFDPDFASISKKETLPIEAISDSIVKPGGTYKYTSPINADILNQTSDVYIRAIYNSDYTKISIKSVNNKA